MSTEHLHTKKVKQVAKKYREQGYNVIIEPLPQQLPTFLGELQPDLIAMKEGDQVVIEVKAKEALRASDLVRHIADAVRKQKGWRFELVLLPSAASAQSTKGWELLGFQEIEQYVKEARHAASLSQFIPAFIFIWIAIEATLRRIAQKSDVSPALLSPKALLKELVFNGGISRLQYRTIEGIANLRTHVVHGFKEEGVNGIAVTKAIKIADKLIKEAKAATR